MNQVIEMKLYCAFGGWPGLVVILAIAAACLAWGWAPTTQTLSNFSARRIAATLAALFVASMAAGILLLGPQELRHEIVHHWTFCDYALALVSNFLWVLVVISATVAIFLRLEFFSGKGWAKRLIFGFGVCCASYLLASLVYILLMPRIRE
jgi:hypothetical protein